MSLELLLELLTPLLSPLPSPPRRTREQAIALARDSVCLVLADRREE